LVAVLIAVIFASGCAEDFVQKMREHPDCAGNVHIAPAKVDYCMDRSNGHRRDFNACLSAQGVPDAKIETLNNCIDARERHESY